MGFLLEKAVLHLSLLISHYPHLTLDAPKIVDGVIDSDRLTKSVGGRLQGRNEPRSKSVQLDPVVLDL